MTAQVWSSFGFLCQRVDLELSAAIPVTNTEVNKQASGISHTPVTVETSQMTGFHPTFERVQQTGTKTKADKRVTQI